MSPNPLNRGGICGRVDRGRSESLKREEERREKILGHVLPPPQVFNFSKCGIELPSCEGLVLARVEVACMSWRKLLSGAQDKDVRPNQEPSCRECLQ